MKKKIEVRLLEDWEGLKKGEIVLTAERSAKLLVEEKIVEIVK